MPKSPIEQGSGSEPEPIPLTAEEAVAKLKEADQDTFGGVIDEILARGVSKPVGESDSIFSDLKFQHRPVELSPVDIGVLPHRRIDRTEDGRYVLGPVIDTDNGESVSGDTVQGVADKLGRTTYPISISKVDARELAVLKAAETNPYVEHMLTKVTPNNASEADLPGAQQLAELFRGEYGGFPPVAKPPAPSNPTSNPSLQ